MPHNIPAFVVYALTGLLAGFLAALFIDIMGLLSYLISGVAGALAGGYALKALGIRLGNINPLVNQIAMSTIGALVVVQLAQMID